MEEKIVRKLGTWLILWKRGKRLPLGGGRKFYTN